MENQHQNPNQPNTPEDSKNSPEQHEELEFYNVMPRSKVSGSVVEPVLKIEETSAVQPPASNFVNWIKGRKMYAIAAIVVIIGAPIAYFVAPMLMNPEIETENLLVENIKETQPEEQEAPPAQFTTPQEWLSKYFPNCTDTAICGDEADPDRDGLNNLQESNIGTDPNNPDSDQDSLADGDEINVFGSNPLNNRTSGNQKYTDLDYVKGGYDFGSDKLLTPNQLLGIKSQMDKFKLHQPTVSALNDVLNKIYNFSAEDIPGSAASNGTDPTIATSSPLAGFDQSLEAKQDRDAQRTNTIKNIGIALIRYKEDNKKYPATGDFKSIYDTIRIYLKVATNPQDPVNIDPYIYTYTLNAKGDDFTLTFYSELANQVIKKHAADALRDMNQEEAGIYDNQRKMDLESLRVALLLYSNKNIAGNQEYVFPTVDKYKTSIMPEFITTVPKDPKTGQDYLYQVSETFNTFTLKAILDNPRPGTTGYLCNQEECREY